MGEVNLVTIPMVCELRRRVLADVRNLIVDKSAEGVRIRWDATVELRPEARGKQDAGKWITYHWGDWLNMAHPIPDLDAALRMVDSFEAEFRRDHPGIRNVIPIRRDKIADQKFHQAARTARKVKAARSRIGQNGASA